MAKKDITKGDFLSWDQFTDKPAAEALTVIYEHATRASKQARDWYWTSIQAKKRASTYSRAFAFFLALVGVATPLAAAAIEKSEHKLILTQVGVAALALAGVMQLGDRVFGWSSGWLRYVTTVTAMEKATLEFELNWATHFVEKGTRATDEDKKELFQLACQFELELKKRQSDETDGWVAEFNSGMAALGEAIKFQKDAVERQAEVARSAVDAQIQLRKEGAVQVSIVQSGASKPVKIIFDGQVVEEHFNGVSWAKLKVAPGMHSLTVELADKTRSDQVVEVVAGTTARLEARFGIAEGTAAAAS